MYFIYNILVYITSYLLKIIAIFHKKIGLFVNGRRHTWEKLGRSISQNERTIWIHCASLGEFEQGRPLIEKLRIQFPEHKLILTFFSPSGYEIRKDYAMVDVICYLPLDTVRNVKKFLDYVHPELVFFVKYEFWPNFLKELKNRNIKTLLISGIFRKHQLFFKSYGSWMRKSLETISHFFVQDENSKILLNSINIENVTISGDTRFDRVYEITKQNNRLEFIESFKNNSQLLIAGSTWKEDEALLIQYINNCTENYKFIIAPHNIDEGDIQRLKQSISKKVVLYSERDLVSLSEYDVFIVDTIGLLTKIYSYAQIAYVGGGYTKTGVHNMLEPATFGIPIIIGPNYDKFKEAQELTEIHASFVANSIEKLSLLLDTLFQRENKRIEAGQKARDYVISKTGATTIIVNYISDEKKII
jgi:3-deoxy-D-manno-octulosonic-acid transferase